MSSSHKVFSLTPDLPEDDVLFVRSAILNKKNETPLNTYFAILAERRDIPLEIAKYCFYEQSMIYVEMLLKQDSMSYAHTVIENLEFTPEHVLFQLSKESIDTFVRDRALSYCMNINLEFEYELDALEEDWKLYNKLKDRCVRGFDHYISNRVSRLQLMYFDFFCKINSKKKQEIVVHLFFKYRDLQLVPHLTKHEMWEYCLENNMILELKQWCYGGAILPEIPFDDVHLTVIQQWVLDEVMFQKLMSRDIPPSESLLYAFGRRGLFKDAEKTNLKQMLHRIVTTGGCQKNLSFIASYDMQVQILKHVETRRVWGLFGTSVFDRQHILNFTEHRDTLSRDLTQILSQITVALSADCTQDTFWNASRVLTEFIEAHCDKEYYDRTTFLEKLLMDMSIEDMIQKEMYPDQFKHLKLFLTTFFEAEEPIDIFYIMKNYLHVNLAAIDSETCYMSNFKLMNPRYPSMLTYLNYLREGRGVYAAYRFFVDTLSQNEKLTSLNTVIAAEHAANLAFNNLLDKNLVTHCIVFMETLGINTTIVRAIFRCVNKIKRQKADQKIGSIHDLLKEMLENIAQVEDLTERFVDLEAIKIIADVNSNALGDKISEMLLKDFDWYKLLLLGQCLNLPFVKMLNLVSEFPDTNLRTNLLLATNFDEHVMHQPNTSGTASMYTYLQEKALQICHKHERNNWDVMQLIEVHQPYSLDFMGVLLKIHKKASLGPQQDFKAFINYLKQDIFSEVTTVKFAYARKWPLFAIISLIVKDEIDVKYLWLIWLATSIDFDLLSVDDSGCFEPVATNVVVKAIKMGLTGTLSLSTSIFYQDTAFSYLTEFLDKSRKHPRNTQTINLLRKFLVNLQPKSSDPIQSKSRDESLFWTADLLLCHIEYNFCIAGDKIWLIEQISNLRHFDKFIDFKLMYEACQLVDGTRTMIDFNIFKVAYNKHRRREKIMNYCSQLEESGFNEKAIRFAKLYNLKIDELLNNYWRTKFVGGLDYTIEMCEQDVLKWNTSKKAFVQFCFTIVEEVGFDDFKKYMWIKLSLDMLQKYNLIEEEFIYLNQFEAKLVLIYVDYPDFQKLPLHHSKFYRNVVLVGNTQNFLLHNTLKEMEVIAKVDEIPKTYHGHLKNAEQKNRFKYMMNILLKKFDIVQAMRYFYLFNEKHEDLHYIMLCMELAEGTKQLSQVPEKDLRVVLADKTILKRLEYGLSKLQKTDEFIHVVTENARLKAYSQADLEEEFEPNQNFDLSSGRINNPIFDDLSDKNYQSSKKSSVGYSEESNIIFGKSSGLYSDSTNLDSIPPTPSKYSKISIDERPSTSKGYYEHTSVSPKILGPSQSASKSENVIATATTSSGRSKIISNSGPKANSSEENSSGEMLKSNSEEYRTVTLTAEMLQLLNHDREYMCNAIQIFASKVKNGEVQRRVAQIYKSSMHMDTDYEIVLKRRDAFTLIKELLERNIRNKLQVAAELMSASKLTGEEIAWFISSNIAENIIKGRFYLVDKKPFASRDTLWGFDLDKEFHLFLNICPNNTLLGKYLMLFYEAVYIYRDQTVYTERNDRRLNLAVISVQSVLQEALLSQQKQAMLQIQFLIKAHQCYLYDCAMEGIVEVLQKSKMLIHNLIESQATNLIIKLLIGLGKYKEMFYCFDILKQNNKFEPIIDKCAKENISGLKKAIMLYLRENWATEKKLLELAASKFSLFKELAESMYNEALTLIETFMPDAITYYSHTPASDKDPDQLPYIKGTKQQLTVLENIMDLLTRAAEFYNFDNQVMMSLAALGKSEMMCLQIAVIHQGHSKYGVVCVWEAIDNPKLAYYLVNHFFTVPQSLVFSRATGYEIDWVKAVYEHCVLKADRDYFYHFLDRLDFTEDMMARIYKLYKQEPEPTKVMEDRIKYLVSFHPLLSWIYKINLNKDREESDKEGS